MLEYRLRIGQRSVRRPPTKWTDAVCKVAGCACMSLPTKIAGGSVGKIYVQQWTSYGRYDDDELRVSNTYMYLLKNSKNVYFLMR